MNSRSEVVIPEKSARCGSKALGMPIAASGLPSWARVSIPNFGRNRRTLYAYCGQCMSPSSAGVIFACRFVWRPSSACTRSRRAGDRPRWKAARLSGRISVIASGEDPSAPL